MERKGIIFTDFDGTLVEKLDPWNPSHWRRNLLKTDLAEIDGWQDFMEGALSVPGISIAGVVSRRPDIPLRRRATERSIKGSVLDGPDIDVALTGSEEAKAGYIADIAIANGWTVNTGMLEDMPQKLVPELIKQFSRKTNGPSIRPSLLIGAVNGPRMYERIGQTIDRAKAMKECAVSCGFNGDTAYFSTDQVAINVMPLRTYNNSIGMGFSNRLYDMQA